MVLDGAYRKIKRDFFLGCAGIVAAAGAGAYLWLKEPAFTCAGKNPDYHAATVDKGLFGTTSIKLAFDIADEKNTFSMSADNKFYNEAKQQAQAFCDGTQKFSLDGIVMSIGE